MASSHCGPVYWGGQSHTYWKVESGLHTPPFSHGLSASQISEDRRREEERQREEMEKWRWGGRKRTEGEEKKEKQKQGGSGEKLLEPSHACHSC